MRQMGEHLQFSVFLCRLHPRRILELEARLGGLINPAEDRLLVVEISGTEAAHQLHGTRRKGGARAAASGGGLISGSAV